MNPNSWLMLCRSVRFGETDAAGVLHFQQLLRWCHEAYEESLERFGLNAAEFSDPRLYARGETPDRSLQRGFRRPLICGSPLTINSNQPGSIPAVLKCATASAANQLVADGSPPCIRADGRQRCELPQGINRWLEALPFRRDSAL